MLGIRLTFHPPQWKWLTDGTADWFWPLAEKYSHSDHVLRRADAEFRRASPSAIRRLTMIADHLGITGDVAKAGRLAEAVEGDGGARQIPERVGQTIDHAVLFQRKPTRSAT